jgi:TonB family protein
MLELKPKPTVGRPQGGAAPENPQTGRLLLALVLLLAALAGVLLSDRQFWFGSQQGLLDSDGTEPAVATRTAAKSAPAAVHQSPSAAAPGAKKQIPAAKTSAEPKPAEAPVVSTNRTVLPPLDVEVVAGDKHSKIHPGSSTSKLEIAHPAAAASADFAAATNAAEREKMATETPQASYPLLAQHMKVQGSVVLQAIIGADGIVQDIHVLSGPAILASAAQQAVREWRFKPVLQNGQPVETKADITVNFTIKVADSSEKTTLAESRASDNLVITR